MANTTQTTPSFLASSRDVRLQIYKHVWKGTTLELLALKGSEEMMEWKADNMFEAFGASFVPIGTLLCTCRQIYQEARPIYHDLVDLKIPYYILPVPKGYEYFVQALDARGDDFKAPFRGFKSITMSVYNPTRHMPIIARLCPDMQRLTFDESQTVTVPCYKSSGVRGERQPFEVVIKSQVHQRAMFGRLYSDNQGTRGGLCHALQRSKSSLGKVRGFDFWEHVKIVFRHELQYRGRWADHEKASRSDITGMLHVESPEGDFDVIQERYTLPKIDTE